MSSLRSQFLRAIEDQREEIRMVSKRNYIKRDLMNYYSLTGDLIKIILGVRRSGKSTFAQLMLSGNDFAYLNFDDERLVGLTANDLNTLLECLHEVYGDFSYLFLDEIQNIPEWSLFVNRLKRLGIKLVVTGSNSKMLSKELASHLTGRYEMAELYPFSFTEYLRYCKINPEGGDTKTFGMIRNKFNEYLQRGGFPEVMESDRPGRVISELFNSVVSKDILYRYKVRHQRTFKEIALTLVGNYGREISFNNIRKQFSIGSDHTVKNYVEYLEEAYLVLTLTKFSFKRIESLRYRKVYAIDPCLIFSLAEDFSMNRGFLLENIVFLELHRRKMFNSTELFYYKQPTFEVDFLVRRNRTVVELIQVCTSLDNPKTLNREVKALVTGYQETGAKQLTIITEDDAREIVFDGVKIRCLQVIDWLLNPDYSK